MSRVNIEHEFIRRRTVEIQLRDSTPVLIRPIVPEDRDRLSEGLARLSPRSTQLRFLRSVGRFSERELSYLTEIDFKDHFAWGAMALDQPAEPGDEFACGFDRSAHIDLDVDRAGDLASSRSRRSLV